MKTRRASIDIGSNSILLLIGDVTNGVITEILKKSEVTSLGKNLDKDKVFIESSMEATLEVLKIYAKDCTSLGIDLKEVIVTATEASRVATNAKDFFQKVKDQSGLEVQIINSRAEAYFSTKGILYQTEFTEPEVTIMDIGGASTELIRVEPLSSQILQSISMPVGSVRSTQWLADQSFVQQLSGLFNLHSKELDQFMSPRLYCVAGTVTSLGNMHLKNKEFHENEVHGLTMTKSAIEDLFKLYSAASPEDLLKEFPFLGKRAASIVGGLHLTYHILHRLGVKEIVVSTYGLRYGTLLEGKIEKDYLHGA